MKTEEINEDTDFVFASKENGTLKHRPTLDEGVLK